MTTPPKHHLLRLATLARRVRSDFLPTDLPAYTFRSGHQLPDFIFLCLPYSPHRPRLRIDTLGGLLLNNQVVADNKLTPKQAAKRLRRRLREIRDACTRLANDVREEIARDKITRTRKHP